MKTLNSKINWEKMDGLVPAVVQSYEDGRVLMIGYMNCEALEVSVETGLVTFFSRSKNRLWTKGKTSGNTLQLRKIHVDCDGDVLLILASATGPTCHTGVISCFGDEYSPSFLCELEDVIDDRLVNGGPTSYVRQLNELGVHGMAQKVGEEGVEVALAAVVECEEELLQESADLLFHLIVLLRANRLSMRQVVRILISRHES
jgi:phosphoribosyl-AMP cyclohydrolase / phosphoribosyl-ATP pyrophosphohydrolase